MLVNNTFLKFGFNGANSRTMSCNVDSFVEQWDASMTLALLMIVGHNNDVESMGCMTQMLKCHATINSKV
jgi:hypothetical protein